MPNVWRKNPRFQCPICKKNISLAVTSDRNPETKSFRITGICVDCRRAFSAKEWRRRHGPHDPWDDEDS